MFDYEPLFADPFRQSFRCHVDRIAAEEGIEIEYIKKRKRYRKEDRIREIIAKRGNHPGLVHIFSVMELVVPAVARQADRDDVPARGRRHVRLLLLLLHR
jgi:hypothetical protein